VWGDYTNYDILPLNEAEKRYPDCLLYVTVARANIHKVTEYLLEKGISRDRIKYAVPVEWRKGCTNIGRVMMFMGDELWVCNNKVRREGLIVKSDEPAVSPDSLINRFNSAKKLIENRIEDWSQGRITSCESCYCLQYDFWEKAIPKTTSLIICSVQNKDYCNFKCTYCEQYPKPEPTDSQARFDEIMTLLEHINSVVPRAAVEFANGEPAITFSAGQTEHILGFMRENKMRFLFTSNASVYSETIASAMKRGRVNIISSLDAGTKETFARIKGVDCFDTVAGNLERYTAAGKNKVTLKYILIKGVNDNLRDITGFLDLAVKLKTKVFLSAEMDWVNRGEPVPLPGQSLEFAFEFIRLCLERSVNCVVIYQNFAPEDARKIFDYEKAPEKA
jgi:wyosine [tRNA(Phe)-imidazoG37] synthetase (radical SAM superfamily)